MMKVKIHIEDDGTYGATIKIHKEYIFTVGKDYKDLWKNIKNAIACVFGK